MPKDTTAQACPDMNAIIDMAHQATKEHGIAVRGGKKYAQVTTRVELFRRNFIGWGIETDIIALGHDRGQQVVVRAIVRDEAGAIKGTGHASEIIGNGGVNTTSALENAETSAIGRALSCLGLHGGEYASLNEMEGVARKAAAQGPMADDPALANEPAPAAPAPSVEADCRAKLNGAASLSGLNLAWKQVNAAYSNRVPPALIALKDERKAALSKGDPQAPADPTEPPF